MTVLYRPVLVESAEQANALPRGTFIRLSVMADSWSRLHSPEFRDPFGADEVPFTALEPIEAAEETREHPRRHEKAPRAGEAYLRPATMTRLVTPWEEA